MGLPLAVAACSTSGADELDAGDTPTDPSDAGAEQADAGAEPDPEPAVAPVVGQLLIEEVYYSGAAPSGGADHYFSDQFIELVNTADVPLDVSGVLIGDAFGVAGPINPGTSPDSFAVARPDEVVLSSVWRVPDGTRMDPGGRLVLAHDGTNHRPFSRIDLSGSHLEAFVASSGNDEDYPTVPNAESVLFNGGYDWLVPVFGASIVVLSAGARSQPVEGPFSDLASFAAADVLDGVDALMDADSGDFKRLPASVDEGFGWVSDTYVGRSLRRRQEDGVFVDTNNSSVDFEPASPSPSAREVELDGAQGTPMLEVGTGLFDYLPLDDGDDIELVAGLQGGWHIDAAVRFSGFGPDDITLYYEALDEGANPISHSTSATLSASRVIAEGEGFIRLGDRVVFDVANGNALIGTTLVLRVVAELGDLVLTDEVTVTVVDNF